MANNPEMNNNEAPKKKSKVFPIVLGMLVIAGTAFGLVKYNHAQHHEETDDAQVDSGINPVIPRVAGYVVSVKVNDNQYVHQGDTLVVLDDRDLRIKLQQAEAALAAARSGLTVSQANTSASRANIATSEANVSTIDAQIETARINLRRTSQDFVRYDNLIKDHSITQQQYEQAQAAKETAEKQLAVLVEQKNVASRQASATISASQATSEQISVASATIQQRMADVEQARLNLSYTVVTAPGSGKVSKVNVQNGQLVQAGQIMFSVVPEDQVWVVANFKETQLDKMKIGQPVTVEIDAFKGRKLEAKVTSFSPATGTRFSLLPPDNASGNFVKVVQRIPVKIEFNNTKDDVVRQLRPGMNVYVDVHIN